MFPTVMSFKKSVRHSACGIFSNLARLTSYKNFWAVGNLRA